jgi:hypothetical protein
MRSPPRAGTLSLGTSGFAYAEWKGSFYPPTIKAKEMLPFYSRRFGAVEINYTFRQLPSPKTIATWREATPAGFRFAIKAHQRITHFLRLAHAEAAVAEFLAALAPLGDRTGPLLFQCPPQLAFERGRLDAFLDLLPSRQRCAFEFRHPSWEEARPLLAARGMAWCVAESDDDAVGALDLASGPSTICGCGGPSTTTPRSPAGPSGSTARSAADATSSASSSTRTRGTACATRSSSRRRSPPAGAGGSNEGAPRRRGAPSSRTARFPQMSMNASSEPTSGPVSLIL